MDRSVPTYTVDTLEELKRSLGPDAGLYFIVGMDALEQFHRWKEREKLLELSNLVIVTKGPLHYPPPGQHLKTGGYPLLAEAPAPPVSILL